MGILRVLFFLFLLTLTVCSLLLMSLIKEQHSRANHDRSRINSLLLKLPSILGVFAITLAPYFSTGSIVTRMGVGPDTSQNIMAAQEYAELDNASFQSITSQLLQITNSTDIDSALTKLRTLPNVRDQAFYDYSISGFRSVIVSISGELLSLIGPSNVLLLQVILLIIILFLLCLSILAASFVLNWDSFQFSVALLSLAINPLTILLFLNGAWAQLLSLPFLIVLVSLFISSKSNQLSSNFSTHLRVLLSSLSLTALGCLVYIESAVVFVPLSVIIFVIIIRRMPSFVKASLSILICVSFSVVVFLFILDPLKIKLSQGLSGYSSTGLDSNTFFSPYNLMGLGNFDSNWILGEQNPDLVFLTSLSLMILALFFIAQKKRINSELILILLICSISLMNAIDKISTYSSMKLSYTIMPILLLSLVNRVPKRVLKLSNVKSALSVSSKTLLSMIALILLTSSIITTSNVTTNSSFWKKSDDQVFKTSFFEKEVSQYPFFTTYIPSATWFGLMGDFKWVNKFPNVVNLEEFSDEKIRIICFDVDPNCVPSATEIPSKLNRFGLKIWMTEYSAGQFQKLSPDERMELSLKLMGQGSFNYSRQ